MGHEREKKAEKARSRPSKTPRKTPPKRDIREGSRKGASLREFARKRKEEIKNEKFLKSLGITSKEDKEKRQTQKFNKGRKRDREV